MLADAPGALWHQTIYSQKTLMYFPGTADLDIYRRWYSEASTTVQGGIDHCENALEAASRELREETGISSARIVSMVGTSACLIREVQG